MIRGSNAEETTVVQPPPETPITATGAKSPPANVSLSATATGSKKTLKGCGPAETWAIKSSWEVNGPVLVP